MNINLKRLNEEQLWSLYGQQIENAVDIKREIKRRSIPPFKHTKKRYKSR